MADNIADKTTDGNPGPGDGGDKPLHPGVDWKPNFPLVRQIDELWYQGERYLCGVMFLIMSLLVFAAVVSSVFAVTPAPLFGFVPRPELEILLFFGAVYLGCKTRAVREGETRLSPGKSAAISAAVTVAVVVVIKVYRDAYPGGVPQLPALSLCMMLWVALLGASMTTFERSHLALEFGEQIWPAGVLHIVKAFARGLTALCCLGLLHLSYLAVQNRYGLWDRGDHLADLVPGLDWTWFPQWVVLLIIPYTFAAMTIRFAAQSFTLVTAQSKPEEEQLPT